MDFDQYFIQDLKAVNAKLLQDPYQSMGMLGKLQREKAVVALIREAAQAVEGTGRPVVYSYSFYEGGYLSENGYCIIGEIGGLKFAAPTRKLLLKLLEHLGMESAAFVSGKLELPPHPYDIGYWNLHLDPPTFDQPAFLDDVRSYMERNREQMMFKRSKSEDAAPVERCPPTVKTSFDPAIVRPADDAEASQPVE